MVAVATSAQYLLAIWLLVSSTRTVAQEIAATTLADESDSSINSNVVPMPSIRTMPAPVNSFTDDDMTASLQSATNAPTHEALRGSLSGANLVNSSTVESSNQGNNVDIGSSNQDDNFPRYDSSAILISIFTGCMMFMLGCIGMSFVCTCGMANRYKRRAAAALGNPNHPQLFPRNDPSNPRSGNSNGTNGNANTAAGQPEQAPRSLQQQQQDLLAQEAAAHLDIVKSMTPYERRQYVACFLKTDKFGCANTSVSEGGRARSGSFTIYQSFQKSSSFSSDSNGSNDDMGNGGVDSSCAICLEPFTDGEDICVSQNSQCSHQFHLVCAFEWLLKSQECPCCRRDYLTGTANDAGVATSPIATTATVDSTPNTTARTGLTAMEILARVGSLGRLAGLSSSPPSPSVAPRNTRHGLTAREMLAGHLTPPTPRRRASRAVSSGADGNGNTSSSTEGGFVPPIRNGLTAREMLAGYSATLPPPPPPLTTTGSRAWTARDFLYGASFGTSTSVTASTTGSSPPSSETNQNSFVSHTRLTARELLAGTVPSVEQQSTYRHQSMTPRELLDSLPRARPAFNPPPPPPDHQRTLASGQRIAPMPESPRTIITSTTAATPTPAAPVPREQGARARQLLA